MKLDVVFDHEGRIVSLSIPGDTGPSPSGIESAGVVVAEGHAAHTLEVPAKLQQRPLVELHEALRVDITSPEPKLVAK
jgi:hypothetical protein